jgi:hypothetical protein
MLKRILGAFRQQQDTPRQDDTDAQVDALYARATEAWARDDLEAARQDLKSALALDNNLPTLHFMMGSISLKRQQYAEASVAFSACLERTPRFPLLLNAQANLALARARADATAGRTAPHEPAFLGTKPLVSVIVCSIHAEKFAAVSANLAQHLAGTPHEIIGVHDARSMCEGQAQGLSRARGDLLLFCHDDIAVHAPDFADRLLNRLQSFELIGVAGSTQLHGEGWLYSRWPHMHGQVGMLTPQGITVTAYHMQGVATPAAMALDGMFLACHRHVAEQLGFDAEIFDGWHLYDFDFSYRAWKAGLRTAVCHDFLVSHASTGGFDAVWRSYAHRFATRHPESRVHFGESETPQLVSVGLESVPEWQWFTHHMTRLPG